MSEGECFVVHVYLNNKVNFAGVFEDIRDAFGYLKSNKLVGYVQPTVMIKSSNNPT